MAATLIVLEKNGPTGAKTNKTSGVIRMKAADNPTVDNNDPVDIPVSGTKLSMEKYLRLEITSPPATDISGLVAYSDAENNLGAGVSLLYRTSGPYAEPVVPANNAGLIDIFTKDSNSPIPLDVVNAGPFTANGEIGDHLVLTMEVASTAQPGPTAQEGITFSYLEK